MHGTCLWPFAIICIFPGSPTTIFYRLVYKFHHFLSKGLSSSKRNHYDLAYLYGSSWDLGRSRRLVHGKTCISCGSERCCLWLSWPADSFGAQKVLIFSETPKERTKGSPKQRLEDDSGLLFEYECPFFVPFRGCPNVGKYTIPMDPMGRGRKMKKKHFDLTSIFFHMAGFSNIFQLLSSNVGGAMYHWALFSWSIP